MVALLIGDRCAVRSDNDVVIGCEIAGGTGGLEWDFVVRRINHQYTKRLAQSTSLRVCVCVCFTMRECELTRTHTCTHTAMMR